MDEDYTRYILTKIEKTQLVFGFFAIAVFMVVVFIFGIIGKIDRRQEGLFDAP